MAKYNSTNNDLLRDSKRNTTPKIYSLLCDLVNVEVANKNRKRR